MTKIRISMALLLASLILLVIYAADELTESALSLGERHDEETESAETGEKHEELMGFLPFSEVIRGSVFAGGAIIMSTIGFVVGREEYSFAVPVLLLINGLLIYTIMFIVVSGVSLTSGLIARANEPLAVGSMFTVAAIMLIAFGIWKLFPSKFPENNIK